MPSTSRCESFVRDGLEYLVGDLDCRQTEAATIFVHFSDQRTRAVSQLENFLAIISTNGSYGRRRVIVEYHRRLF